MRRSAAARSANSAVSAEAQKKWTEMRGRTGSPKAASAPAMISWTGLGVAGAASGAGVASWAMGGGSGSADRSGEGSGET